MRDEISVICIKPIRVALVFFVVAHEYHVLVKQEPMTGIYRHTLGDAPKFPILKQFYSRRM